MTCWSVLVLWNVALAGDLFGVEVPRNTERFRSARPSRTAGRALTRLTT